MSDGSLYVVCHPERTEGSDVFEWVRFLALLGMTINVNGLVTSCTEELID